MVQYRGDFLKKCKWAPLEKPWGNLLGRYCRFIARHPWPFIVVPTILTCILSTGIFSNFKIVRGVHYLYAPLNAQWKSEEAVFHQNWAANDEQFYPGKDILRRKGLYLTVEAVDKGNLLRPDYAKEFVKFIDWVATESFVTSDGIEYSYRNICLRFQNDCFTNAHARFIAEIFARNDQAKFNVTYPKFYSEFSTEPIDLSKTLGGVTTDSDGRLINASAWMILYQLSQYDDQLLTLSSDFELAITAKIKNKQTPTTLFNIFYFHSDTFEVELAETSRQIAPSFALTFTILIIFSVLCTFNINWVSYKGRLIPVIDWVISKPLMGIIGVIVTIMAIISATGLLLLLDVTFVDMATVMPFLSLTVGIDDTFLMLAAWHETSRKLSVEERIEASMRHAAVSISITSLTDAIAFLIGAIAPLPAIIYFCYYSSAAICFIFCYSLTIFVACLSIQGHWEEASRNSIGWVKTKPLFEIDDSNCLQRLFNMGSRIEPCIRTKNVIQKNKHIGDDRLWYQRFFEDLYAPVIAHTFSQIIALVSFTAYVAFAVMGAQQVNVGFDPVNIIQKDSPSRKFFEIRTKLFPEDVSKIDVAVMKPPNMGNEGQRIEFFDTLEELENSVCSQGRNSTDLWYFAYEKYLEQLGFDDSWQKVNENEEDFNNNIKPFLMANEKYAHDILYHQNGTMKAFRFTTQLLELPTDERIMYCAKVIRNFANSHKNDYNISTYTPLWVLADQFEIMWPQTLQDLYISIAVMVPISLILIPQPLCALVVALNIASIALGVIGFMTWWNVNLDATSMITIAMSVGFSVDFAAHITYGYMTENKRKQLLQGDPMNAPYAHLVGALGAVGWPISQASISVLIGIIILATIDSFIVQTCFKTVFLVVIFGTLHALVYLPLILMRLHYSYLWLTSKRKTKTLNGHVVHPA